MKKLFCFLIFVLIIHLTIDIENSKVLGREVTPLVNKQLKPGNYETEFNGTNYPSGVYFYKLISGNNSETRKMILVK